MSIVEQVFKVSPELQAAFLMADRELDEKGAVSPEVQNKIDKLLADQENVLTELCNWYLATEAKFEGMKAEYQPILDKIESDFAEMKAQLARIEGFISVAMPKSDDTQIANESVYAYWKHTQAVEIEDPEIVPIEFTEYVPKISKDAIKAVLKTGGQVPGARLQDNYNLQVKVGGLRAMKNAKARLKRATE